jgi:SAM-dependent methyltransferase
MNYDLSDESRARNYLAFSLSPDGLKQQASFWAALEPLLPKDKNSRALDIGCGMGWLSHKLSSHYKNITSFDTSLGLLSHAREKFPGIDFVEANLTRDLPWPEAAFDLGVACLVMHDLPDLNHGFGELARIIRPSGSLFLIGLNPYYAHPVGSWKRTLGEILAGRKPRFKIRPYMPWRQKSEKAFRWRDNVSLFYSLPEMLNTAAGCGFELAHLEDIGSARDSSSFDHDYRTSRFPIFLVYQFIRKCRP